MVEVAEQQCIEKREIINIISYGGGVQSTALLVLASQGVINYSTFIFCNVGDDSEHPDTLRYVREVAMPYAEARGIELIELHKTRRDGERETLYQRLTRPESRSVPIPVRMQNGAPGRRACTVDFKIRLVNRWLKQQGAAKQGARVGLGISLDEIGRMKPNLDPRTQWKENTFPLLLEVPAPLTRADCIRVIAEAGLPIPPKSSCWFCPFHRLSVWQEMRQHQPTLFEKAVALEVLLNERRCALGKDPVWLTAKGRPLDEVTTKIEQPSLFDETEWTCDTGFCFT